MGGEWFLIEDLKHHGSSRFYTAGFVVYEDEHLTKVVSTVSEDQETGGHDTIIPNGYIVSRTVLSNTYRIERQLNE